jgi:hypothetical protein
MVRINDIMNRKHLIRIDSCQDDEECWAWCRDTLDIGSWRRITFNSGQQAYEIDKEQDYITFKLKFKLYNEDTDIIF